jgi:predicted MFS family arabinose efflux permease
MVPRRLWERVNAVDSNGWVVATIVGPPIAAVVVGVAGGPVALIVIGVMYGIAALVVSGVPEPAGMPATDSTGRLLLDAWRGLLYTWRNPTLRGLGFSISILNVGWGMQAIIVPLIVLDRLGMSEATVGLVFAVQGIAGVVTGFVAGLVDTRRREVAMIAVPMVLMAPALALLLPASSLVIVIAVMALTGALNGPMDVAMFTLRQRRTDPAWMGRAFAVSMSFNFSGFPIGAAIGGTIAAWSLDAAILVGVVSAVVSGVVAVAMVPRHAPEEWTTAG